MSKIDGSYVYKCNNNVCGVLRFTQVRYLKCFSLKIILQAIGKELMETVTDYNTTQKAVSGTCVFMMTLNSLGENSCLK